jgi:hypothetical protein
MNLSGFFAFSLQALKVNQAKLQFVSQFLKLGLIVEQPLLRFVFTFERICFVTCIFQRSDQF